MFLGLFWHNIGKYKGVLLKGFLKFIIDDFFYNGKRSEGSLNSPKRLKI